MTSQIKHFVEVDDIRSLVLECKHCQQHRLSADTVKFPRACPSCQILWVPMNAGSGVVGLLEQLFQTVNMRKASMGKQTAQPKGFTIRVEVAGLEASHASSTRDA